MTTTQHENVDRRGSRRTAVITGAGSGIGAATARALAASGAAVAVLGRRPDRLQAVADEIGALAIPTDVSAPEQLQTAASVVTDELGSADLIVANAGAMLADPFDTADRAEWQRMVEVNLMGVFDTARTFVPHLLAAAEAGRRADLVLVSSLGAQVVMPTYAVYFATKAAVTHFATNLRAELGPRGVRVHSIEPGMTASELGGDMASAPSRAALAEFRDQVPPIPAEAVAESIAWITALPPAVNIAQLTVLPTVQG